MLETHNVMIEERRTSIRLEPELWKCLKDIADEQFLTLQEVCTAIHLGHGASSYTAAVRLFILLYYWEQAAGRRYPGIVGPIRQGDPERRDPRFRTRYGAEDDDFDRRTIWNPDQLERTPEAGMFLAYWQWIVRRRALGRLPRYEDMLTGPFEEEFRRGTLNIIDTTAENPEGYMLAHLSSTSNRLFAGGRAIGELSFKLHARSLAAEAHEIKTTGQPHVASISQRRDGVNRAYVRLALPLTDDHGRVTQIATIVRGLRTKPSIFSEKLFGLAIPTRQPG